MSFTESLTKLQCKFNKLFRGYAGIPIRQKDVDSHGIRLRCKGKYYLAEDITWCPTNSGSPTAPIAAITIEKSNISLDLNGYTLQQKGDASFTVGIFITNGSATSTSDFSKPNLNNIIVRNGTIQHINTAGILVNKVNELLFENLYTVRNGASGFILCPCTAQRAGGIVYVSFAPGQVPAPFLKNHIWRNLHCDSNSTKENGADVFPLQGADISVVDNVFVENCTFNNNSSREAMFTLGIELLTNTNVRIANCQANSNNGFSNFVLGFECNLTNFIFENCQANSNNGDGLAEGFSVETAFVTENTNNGVFQNCTANGNTSFSEAIGFDIESNINTFTKCQANNNVSSGEVAGFFIAFVTDTSYLDCESKENSSLLGTAGFVASACSRIKYENCNATGNMTTGDADGIPVSMGTVGFGARGSDQVICKNCVATGQINSVINLAVSVPTSGFLLELTSNSELENCTGSGSTALVPFGIASGFHIGGSAISLTNCKAENNNGTISSNQYELVTPDVINNINVVNSFAIGNSTQLNSVGILLQNTSSCVIDANIIENNAQGGILLTGVCPLNTQNIIKHNQIIAPSAPVAGTWAIEDDTAPTGSSTNNYYDNQAFNYPGTSPSLTNYNPGMRSAGGSDPTNGFIATWSVPGAPPAPPLLIPGISNLDVTDAICSSIAKPQKMPKETHKEDIRTLGNRSEIKNAMKNKNYKQLKELLVTRNKRNSTEPES